MDIDPLPDLPDKDHLPYGSQLLQHLPGSELTTADAQDIASKNLSSPSIVLAQKLSRIDPVPHRAGSVITKIESIFESIIDCVIGEKKELVIQLKSRSKQKSIPPREDNDTDLRRKSDIQKIKFPSKCPTEAWRFGM